MSVVKIDDDALIELKQAVLERHGKLRGVLGKEASTAVREHAQTMLEGLEQEPER